MELLAAGVFSSFDEKTRLQRIWTCKKGVVWQQRSYETGLEDGKPSKAQLQGRHAGKAGVKRSRVEKARVEGWKS